MNALQEAIDQAIASCLFKPKIIDDIRQIACLALESAEAEFEQHLKIAQRAQQDALTKAHTAEHQRQVTLTQSQRARKMAVARGNRYKAKYDALLAAIDTVLPGAKTVLTERSLPEAEKAKRLAKLADAIKQQRALCQSHIQHDPERYRDTYGPGYGKARRLLERLLDRQARLTHIKTY